MNLIYNIKYFIESSQFSELPPVFNSVTSIEFPTNHVLYFMDFTQLNSSKDAPYFYIPIFYFIFTPLLFTFILSECKSNNRKTIISPKRSMYQPRTKKWSFLNKTESHHFSFTTSFIICRFILVFYLLAYTSEPKETIYISSLTEYKFGGLEFLEFQNKSKNSLNIFHYQIYALSKMKIKNYDSFFSFALLLSGDIQLNPGPTSDVCFVCKRTLNKISFCYTKCYLRAHKKCSNTVFFDSDICSDCKRWENLPFHNVSFVLMIVAIQNHLC